MSFFSHLRKRGCYHPHGGSGYFQQPPTQQPYPNSPALTSICPNCQAVIAADSNFCSNCGSKTAQNIVRKCNRCGAVTPNGSKFCPNCGNQV
ncbi:zinc-ribbon domain-containing protein [Hydrogenoanaerobacterium sp.]|uniref:zinc-ribbon domain-containing protein n=1 Tax=Hydrogenoanaerobacterium sp. TaxID=2953763 RepID=UPI0037C0CAE9